MYRLSIRDPHNLYMSHYWWRNFSTYFRASGWAISGSEPRDLGNVILDEFNGIYNGGTMQYIEFENEEDALAFVLRFS